MSSRLVVIKIGGSVLNPKSSYATIRRDLVYNIGKVLARFRREGWRFIIIHGGGGLAHTTVHVYRPCDSERGDVLAGLAVTKSLLLYLKSVVSAELLKSGLPVYPLDTEAVVRQCNEQLVLEIDKVRRLLDLGLIPVLNGDIEVWHCHPRIISGDLLMLKLAELLHPDYCIFLIDKDGVLDPQGNTIRVLTRENVRMVVQLSTETMIDVTGGILAKLDICFRIAELGVKTYVCPGFRPEELANLLREGCSDKCTEIRS